MRKFLPITFFALLTSALLNAQTGDIKFTLKRGSAINIVDVFIKNTGATTFSNANNNNAMGPGTLNISVGWRPKNKVGNPTIASSTLPGMIFSNPVTNGNIGVLGADSVWAWVADNLSTGTLNINPGQEIKLATITFNGTVNYQTDSIMLIDGDGINGSPTIQNLNFIAPGGVDQSGYGTKDAFYGGDFIFLSGDDNITSFVGISDKALPIAKLSFFAIKDNNDNAKLNWTVYDDNRNSYYSIERSVDGGKNFTQIQKVNSYQNGKSENTYEINDLNLSTLKINTIFYRVIIVGKSGDKTSSEIRSISLDSKKLFTSLYPNPAINTTKLIVDAPEAGKASLVIRDAAGKTVQQINTNFVKGVNQQQVNVSMFAAGDYHVTILGGGINETIKLTKVN